MTKLSINRKQALELGLCKPNDIWEEGEALSVEEYLKRLNYIVHGDLDLKSPDFKIKSLPDNLIVKGNLSLYGNKNLVSLGKNLKVGGDLSLAGCKSLTALPDGLEVGGNLYVNECIKLKHYPENLIVKGKCNLPPCPDFPLDDYIRRTFKDLVIPNDHYFYELKTKSLPEGMHVKGNLQIRQCALQSLPKNLKVEGTLTIEYCDFLDEISGAFDCKELKINFCKGLKNLNNVSVPKLYLLGLPLHALRNVRVQDLEIVNCKELASIDGKIDNCLAINVCSNLKILPDMRLNKCVIIGCPIEKLPSMRVYGSAYLSCKDLKSLPDDLFIAGNLVIARVKGGKELPIPESATIKGEVKWVRDEAAFMILA
jgi:hypothetical protein